MNIQNQFNSPSTEKHIVMGQELIVALQEQNTPDNYNKIISLMQKGADVHQTCKDGRPPLLHAIFNGKDNRIIDMILKHGADISFTPPGKRTALLLASIHGNTHVIKKCIEMGINLNQRTDDGWDAFSLACINGHLKSAKMLVANGANIDGHQKHDIKNMAKDRSFVEVAKYLQKDVIKDHKEYLIRTKRNDIAQAVQKGLTSPMKVKKARFKK